MNFAWLIFAFLFIHFYFYVPFFSNILFNYASEIIYLFYLFIYLFIYLSIYLSIYLFIYFFIYLLQFTKNRDNFRIQ